MLKKSCLLECMGPLLPNDGTPQLYVQLYDPDQAKNEADMIWAFHEHSLILWKVTLFSSSTTCHKSIYTCTYVYTSFLSCLQMKPGDHTKEIQQRFQINLSLISNLHVHLCLFVLQVHVYMYSVSWRLKQCSLLCCTYTHLYYMYTVHAYICVDIF